MAKQKANSVNVSIRVDEELKGDVEKLFKRMGMSFTSALTIFMRQCLVEQGMPFIPSLLSSREQESERNAKYR